MLEEPFTIIAFALLFGFIVYLLGVLVVASHRQARDEIEQHRRENARREAERAQREAEEVAAAATARAEHEKKFPEPFYSLSDDPVLASIERQHISDTVGPWSEFQIDEDQALGPYIAAGDALTQELQEAIIQASRRSRFLGLVEAAKVSAAKELSLRRLESEEARQRLADFMARHRIDNP